MCFEFTIIIPFFFRNGSATSKFAASRATKTSTYLEIYFEVSETNISK
jgi:hypothetical protein